MASSSSLVQVPTALQKTRVLGESGDVRLLDAGIIGVVALGSGIWSATRPTVGQRVGWELAWVLLSSLGFVEGSGSLLRFGSAGVLGANALLLGLELAHINPDASA